MNAFDHASSKTRKATNLSLDVELLKEARSLGINISRACEMGLAENIVQARKARWLADNADAIASSNEYVQQHGLPLARHRRF